MNRVHYEELVRTMSTLEATLEANFGSGTTIDPRRPGWRLSPNSRLASYLTVVWEIRTYLSDSIEAAKTNRVSADSLEALATRADSLIERLMIFNGHAQEMDQGAEEENEHVGFGQLILTIKTIEGQSIILKVASNTVEVKTVMRFIEQTGIQVEMQSLIYQGKRLKPETTLKENGINGNSTLVLVLDKANFQRAPRSHGPVNGGRVISIESISEYKTILERAGDKLVIVLWYSTWVWECALWLDPFRSMAEYYNNTLFLLVNTVKSDAAQELTAEAKVDRLPSVRVYRNIEPIAQMDEPNVEELEQFIVRHGGMCVGPSTNTTGDINVDKFARHISVIQENTSPEDFLSALRLLQTFVKNIIERPEETSVRRLRESYQPVQNRLLSRRGGLQALLELGCSRERIDGETFLVMERIAPQLPRVKNMLEGAVTRIRGEIYNTPNSRVVTISPASTTLSCDPLRNTIAGNRNASLIALELGEREGLLGLLKGYFQGAPSKSYSLLEILKLSPESVHRLKEILCDPEVCEDIRITEPAQTPEDVRIEGTKLNHSANMILYLILTIHTEILEDEEVRSAIRESLATENDSE